MDIHLASLEVFTAAGLDNVFKKSKMLSDFLFNGLSSINNFSKFFNIITPRDTNNRGSQISLFFKKNSKDFFNELSKKFVVDYRKPDVIRVAPDISLITSLSFSPTSIFNVSKKVLLV